MPLSDRDYIRGKHPPACTCTDCVKKRLGRTSPSAHWSPEFDSQRVEDPHYTSQCTGCLRYTRCPYNNQPSISSNSGRSIRRSALCDSYEEQIHKLGCSCVVCRQKRLDQEASSYQQRDSITTSTSSPKETANRKLGPLGCGLLILACTIVIGGVYLLTDRPTKPTIVTDTIPTTSITTPSKVYYLPTTTTTTTPPLKGVDTKTGYYRNYYLGLVYSPNVDAGNGCYDSSGDFIVLINSTTSTNPTYAELLSFLQSDPVDRYPYIYTTNRGSTYYGTAESHVNIQNISSIIDRTSQPGNPKVCADFAERLHNDAEMAGIRCAYVSIDLTGYTDPNHYGISSDTSHALDAFQTTDQGLVFIDDTGLPTGQPGPSRCTKTVSISVGSPYIPISLFPEVGWNSTWNSSGTVTACQITWDGDWNSRKGIDSFLISATVTPVYVTITPVTPPPVITITPVYPK